MPNKQVDRARPNLTQVWLSDDEKRMLDELVERSGLSKSDVLRQSLRGTHAEMEGRDDA